MEFIWIMIDQRRLYFEASSRFYFFLLQHIDRKYSFSRRVQTSTTIAVAFRVFYDPI